MKDHIIGMTARWHDAAVPRSVTLDEQHAITQIHLPRPANQLLH
jgi:hypothetical protein